MTEPIRGKVAKVLTSRELAINVGSNHGVTVGMVFEVIDTFDSIIDPDTKEPLGSIERIKVKVQVTQVKEQFSLASTFSKKRVNVGGNLFDLGPLSAKLMPANWVTRYETLRKDDYRHPEKISEDESYVKRGDTVLQVCESDEGMTPRQSSGAQPIRDDAR